MKINETIIIRDKRDYIPVFYRYEEMLAHLTDEQFGKLMIAMLEYAEFGIVSTELDDITDLAFGFLRYDYNKWCEKNL